MKQQVKKGQELVYSKESLSNFVKGVTNNNIIGIKKNDLTVKKVDKQIANKIIINNHYSHKTATDAHTKLHLGIFYKEKIVGAMQYGYAMNPTSCNKIVKETTIEEYLELNRLWISDKVPIRNVETQVIGLSIKLIKILLPKIKWIQSFADGRVGVGTIYQASSFIYCGSHETKFLELGGELHHEGKFRNKKRSFGRKYNHLYRQKSLPNKSFEQYRYIFFIDKRERKNLLLKEQPYPKRKNWKKNND